MKKYALYTYPGRESERGWPQLGGEEMEQTCVRLSDWYHPVDDLAAVIEAKDLETEKYKAIIADKNEIAHRFSVLDAGRRNHINDLRRRIVALQLEKGTCELRFERAMAGLFAVRERCEANNWMGNARLCGETDITNHYVRIAAAAHGFLEYGSGACLDGLLEEMQRAGYDLDEYTTVVAALRGSQRVIDRARAVVASWEQWQHADDADKPAVWRYVESGMERLREAVDASDAALSLRRELADK